MTTGLAERRTSAAPTPARRRQDWSEAVVDYWSQVRVLDFLGGALIIVGGLPITVGGAPMAVAVAAVIAALAMFLRPQVRVLNGGLMVLVAIGLYSFLVVVSMLQHMPWEQRTLRFVIILAVAAAVAARRIDTRSLILGAMTALVANVPAFYLGLVPNNYPPYLTGLLGDKNVAGMYYALFGLLGLLVTRGRYWGAGWLAFSGTAVFLTGSRTSISAFVLALAWLALRNRVAPLIRWILTACGVWVLIFVETTFARIGMFADRTGTDLFREQIELAMADKVAATPWYGGGLNQGFVMLGGVRRMWFHDSYLQAFAEGGYVFLGATLIAFVVAGLGLFSPKLRVGRELLIAEAGIVTVLVCAWKLGEVFMTTGAFIALGIAVGARFGRERTEADLWWEQR